MKNPFGPLLTAMVTPFDRDGNVDYEKAVELANYLFAHGSDGIILTGTTGEAPSLTMHEKKELFRILVSGVKHGHAVLAGTGNNNTVSSMELTRAAEKAGLAGIMLVTPYYSKPPQEGLFLHFKEIAATTSLPVIVYNVPNRTGVNLGVETTLRLAEIDNIVALKDASGSTEQASAIIHNAPDGFAVYSGDDPLLLPFLIVGAHGVISVASHIVGPRIKNIIDLYFEGNINEAARQYREILPFFKGMFMMSNPIPVKESLNLLGFPVGLPRLPLVPMPQDFRNELKNLLKMFKVELYS